MPRRSEKTFGKRLPAVPGLHECHEELWNGFVWLERVLSIQNMYIDGTSLE